MERKIGEIFEHNGEWYQCIKGLGCNECDLSKLTCYHRFKSGSCSPNMRKDKTQVIFKKLEKVGEPYEHCGKLYQCYKLPMEIEIRLLPNNCNPIGKDNLVEIEIKQNKEDMEEKNNDTKHSNSENIGKNLKEFDINLAKQGQPVCTRDGGKARIICFNSTLKNYPLVVLIEGNEGEYPYVYTAEGKIDEDERESVFDLMMLPEKKEGWINVYKNQIHNTLKSAEEGCKGITDYIKTIKVEWEE